MNSPSDHPRNKKNMLSSEGAPESTGLAAVMTVRERYSLTTESLFSLRKELRQGEPIILAIDDYFPPELLPASSKELQPLRIVKRKGRWRQNELRKWLVSRLTQDIILFVDNDVMLQEGTVARLLECFHDEGVGAACPIITWGMEPFETVHFGGGRLKFVCDDDGTHLVEEHQHMGKAVEILEGGSTLRESDFVEFHCLLMSRRVCALEGVLDKGLRNVHAHIGDALAMKRHGYRTVVAPQAFAHYGSERPYLFCDLGHFAFQWDVSALEQSIAVFCETWNVQDSQRSFGPLRNFVHRHRAKVLAVPEKKKPSHAARAMDRGQAIAHLGALLDLAADRGFDKGEIDLLEETYWLAAHVTAGGFLPGGRPFVTHLLGTAGILLHFGFALRLVRAGMLYFACRPMSSQAAAQAEHKRLTQEVISSAPLKDIFRNLPRTKELWNNLRDPGWKLELTQPEVETIVVNLCAICETALAGDGKLTGHESSLPIWLEKPLYDICSFYGVVGLWKSMSFSGETFGPSQLQASFRIGDSKVGRLFSADS